MQKSKASVNAHIKSKCGIICQYPSDFDRGMVVCSLSNKHTK